MAFFPATHFSTCWVAGNLIRGGIDIRRAMAGPLEALRRCYSPEEIGAGEAMPPDADDTAMAIHVLNHVGGELDPAILERWWNESAQAYVTYCKKSTYSPDVSVNCRILQAYLSAPRTLPAMRRLVWDRAVRFLERSAKSGYDGKAAYWLDRWNISPMYPVHEIVCVLSRYAGAFAERDPTALHHLAIEWILRQQRMGGAFRSVPDEGAELEETAYAVLALKTYLNAGWTQHNVKRGREIYGAIRRAEAYLDTASLQEGRAFLWLGKALYRPKHIIAAAACAARNLQVLNADSAYGRTETRP